MIDYHGPAMEGEERRERETDLAAGSSTPVTNDSVFRRILGDIQEATGKKTGYYEAASRGGHGIRVAAFCQSLSRCNVIDGGNGGTVEIT